MLVNKDSTSILTIYNELSYVVISLEKLKESLILHSLWVRGSSTGIRSLAILYPGVFLADRIDENKNKNIWYLKSNNKNLYNGKLSKRDPFTLLETATS